VKVHAFFREGETKNFLSGYVCQQQVLQKFQNFFMKYDFAIRVEMLEYVLTFSIETV